MKGAVCSQLLLKTLVQRGFISTGCTNKTPVKVKLVTSLTNGRLFGAPGISIFSVSLAHFAPCVQLCILILGDILALTPNPDKPVSVYRCDAVNCMGTVSSTSVLDVSKTLNNQYVFTELAPGT